MKQKLSWQQHDKVKMHGCKMSRGLVLRGEEERVRWLKERKKKKKKKIPAVTLFAILEEEDSLLNFSSCFYIYLHG